MAKKRVQKKHKMVAPANKCAPKVKKVKKVMADQETDVIGNGAERVVTPEEMSYVEDTRKPEIEIIGTPTPDAATEQYFTPPEPFDAKKLIDDILKKYGV